MTMAVLAAVFTAKAADYEFLTFELKDGTKTSVQASGLSITFSGSMLTAGNETFSIENLNKMYFSSADETTDVSEELRVKSEDFATAIFDLQGHQVTKEQMRSGQVYIVKTNQGTHKLTVK